ncbi:MAG: tRNA pseudouridine(13) synthase TruD [Aquificae bacterium]|nr:tRNA pseudouridine(13) synthase TruD [Aquificota bacterium]
MAVRLKETPEDFFVKEVKNLKLKEKGRYAYLLLRKRNLNTLDALNELSRSSGVPLKRFGFLGLKDKKAVTEQYLSVEEPTQEELERLLDASREDMQLELVGFGDEPLKLGEFEGNYFRIKVKGVGRRERKVFARMRELVKNYGCENYFGEQRFGSVKHAKEFVVKHLIRGDYEAALKEYLTSLKDKRLRRTLLKRWGDWESFLRVMPAGSKPERELVKALKRGLSFKEAFNVLPKNVRLMFVFAYQSYLWNAVLYAFVVRYLPHCTVPFLNWELAFFNRMSPRVWEEIKDLEIPFLGFKEKPQNLKVELVLKEVLEREGVTPELARLERGGIKLFTDGKRKAFFRPGNLSWEEKGSEVTLSFVLPPGSYATVLVRKLFCADVVT